MARDGDYFGRAVNVAARILNVAAPGELLATAEVAAQDWSPSLQFEALGPISLKGVSAPVLLFRASQLAAGGSAREPFFRDV